MHAISFKKPIYEAIIAGLKTQTRRPVLDGELECRYGKAGDVRYISYQKERLLFLRVRREHLLDITEEDARAEGFGHGLLSARDEFLAIWNKLYASQGMGIDKNPEVWVIEFCLTELPYRSKHALLQWRDDQKTPQ